MADTNRAAYVQQQYRYVTAIDPSIKARFSDARDVSIDTQLDEATATTLANNYLSLVKVANGAFEATVLGIIDLDDFAMPPRYVANDASLALVNQSMMVIAANPDRQRGITALTMRAV